LSLQRADEGFRDRQLTLIAVTSIVRRAAPDEQSSFLRLVDVDRAHVLATVAIPESHGRSADPNPRGGHRGARGVSAFGDRLVLATNDRLLVLDPSWRLVEELAHRWIGGIHDVLATEDGIWVTSTAASSLIKLDWRGKLLHHWHWADDPGLANALGFRNPPAFDTSIDYRVPVHGIGAHDVVHMNSVVARGSGLLLSLGQIRSPAIQRWQGVRGAVMRIAARLPLARKTVAWLRNRRMSAGEARSTPAPSKRGASHAIVELELEHGRPGSSRILWRQGGVGTPKHNVGLVRDSEAGGEALVFNDSEVGVAVVDLTSGALNHAIAVPGSPTFSRGLCMLSDDECLVGSQRPAAIYRVSLRARVLLGSIDLDGKPWETVYAIGAVPEEFSQNDFDGFDEWAQRVNTPL
jgi:hypothetical protein